jgi:long-subunit fatty acid transport protein
MEWEYTVTWAFGTDSDTINLTYDEVITEKDLVLKNEGIKWTVSGSAALGFYGNQMKSLGGGVTLDMAITSSAVPSVDYPQVIYDSTGNLWLPRVTVYCQISDDGSVSGNEYTLGLSNDPTSTYYGGADTINTSLSGKTITLTGTYDGIGGPVTLSFSPTNWPYA